MREHKPYRDPLGAALERKALTGETGAATSSILASGTGWRVVDVLCTSGPADRPFEERYWSVAISLILAGTFSYRSSQGSSLMSPGSLLLGNVNHSYECSHEHGEGDRCLSFQFEPGFFETVARDIGVKTARFPHHRIPPVREIAPLTARAAAAIEDGTVSLEEVAVSLAGRVLRLSHGLRDDAGMRVPDRGGLAAVLHHLELNATQPQRLDGLARIAGLSRYHFLRSFRMVTGVTPHQWVMRARLREAARLLIQSSRAVTEVALDAGFDDLSNFIRSFRAEFGTSPSRYRSRARNANARPRRDSGAGF